MKNKLPIVSVLLVLIITQGCASVMTYNHNKEKVKSESIARGTENTEPTFYEVVKRGAGLQAGALAVDVLVGYVGYEGYKSLNNKSDNNSEPVKKKNPIGANENSSGENTTIIQGDGNTVTITKNELPIEPTIIE